MTPVEIDTDVTFKITVRDAGAIKPRVCGQGWGWNEMDPANLTNKSRWILAEKDAGNVGFFLDATNAIGWTAKNFAYGWENVSGEQGGGVATLPVEYVNGGKGGTSTISCEINYNANGVSSSTRTNDAWRVSVRNPPTFDGNYMLEVFDDDGNALDTLMERARFGATFTNANDTAGVEKWSLLPYPIKKAYAESSADSTFNANVGTATEWQADEGFWPLDISKLNFPFYGDVYTTLWIDSNGRILLGDYYGYGDAIDVLFGDLTTEGGNIYVDTNANDRVTIRWKAKYVKDGNPVNASATLNTNGTIVLAYGAGNAGGGAIGLHSGIRDLDSGSLLEHPSKSGSGSMEKAKDIVFTPGNVNTYGGIKIARNGSAERRTKSVSDIGVLSGSFGKFGTYNFVVVARGDYGATARAVSFDVNKNPAIRPEPTCDPDVGDINLEGATNLTFTVTATTSSKVTFTWSLDGVGTQSKSNRAETISDFTNSFKYVAQDLGSHTIRCEVRDDDDPDNVTTFEWRVFSFVFEGGELPGVMEGYDLDAAFPIKSATGPYTLTFDGDKPEWLRAWVEKGGDDGDLYRLHFAGKPDSGDAGTYTFTATVANAFGDEAAAVFTVTVEENPNKRPVVTKRPDNELMVLAVSTLGVTNSVELIAEAKDPNEEDTLAYSWSVPEGIAADKLDGPAVTLHGDIEIEGRFTVRCDVTDGFWTNGVTWLILVGDYPVIDTESPLGDAREGDPYSSTLEGHGGSEPYAWSILPYAEMSDKSSYAEVGSPAFRDEYLGALTGFGFQFPFAGEEYNKLWINRHGTITFGDDSFRDAYDDKNGRSAFLSRPMIAVLWGDLSPDTAIYIACENDTCTISWRGTYVTNGAPVNASATLYADGRIVLSYGDGNDRGGFIGVSMGDGKTFLEPLWSHAGSMNKADDMIFIPSRLPTGLGLGEADGVLSGTPSDAGEFTFGVCLTDAEGRTATKNFTLNVAEVIPENTYRVYFEANGGSGEMKPQTLECGESVALSTSSFTRTGHVFDGWATSAEGAVEYADGATVADLVEAGKRITLWAKWKAGAYAIAFDANGGEGEMDSLSRLIGESAALPANAFTRVGFMFEGWATATNDVAKVAYADGATVLDLAEVGGRITLYAVWKAAVSAITLDAAGGTGGTAAVSVPYGGAMPDIAVPVLTGYSFGGYFTEVGGAGTQYYTADGASARAWDGTADATLHAWWIPTQYTVTFNANGGEGWIADQSVVYGSWLVLTENDFTRNGYVFIGWALSHDGAVAYGDEEWVQNLSDNGGTVPLYAKWAKKNYKVKFYANGGKGTMKTQAMTYGKAKKLTANKFKRDGYAFKGWATSKKLAKKGKVTYKNKKKVKNLTTTGKTVKLYAVWKKRR